MFSSMKKLSNQIKHSERQYHKKLFYDTHSYVRMSNIELLNLMSLVVKVVRQKSFAVIHE